MKGKPDDYVLDCPCCKETHRLSATAVNVTGCGFCPNCKQCVPRDQLRAAEDGHAEKA